MPRPTVASIDLDALMQNVRQVRELVGGRVICAPVKADGYGHGAVVAARAMSLAGVEMFAAAMTEEAVELRERGIREPIILLTTVPSDDIEALLDYSITACVVDEGFAGELSLCAVRRGVKAQVHVNVDTGMRRVGIDYLQAAKSILNISRMPGIELAGIFTHFACADADDLAFCREQLKRFHSVVRKLKAAGVEVPLLHAANSNAVLRIPESYFDAVRPGLILYGLYPRESLEGRVRLRPVLSLRTQISFLKDVAAGERIGYGHTFTAWRNSAIATLPMGYYDGFLREYSNLGEVLVRGRRVPVVGRVCMDQTLIDVTDVPGVQVGDEVVAYGEQQGRSITIEEMARRVGRIPYELTCSVGRRVRRRFIAGGQIAAETPMHYGIPEATLCRISRALAVACDEEAQSRAGKRGAA